MDISLFNHFPREKMGEKLQVLRSCVQEKIVDFGTTEAILANIDTKEPSRFPTNS
jgi:hypothetical protein